MKKISISIFLLSFVLTLFISYCSKKSDNQNINPQTNVKPKKEKLEKQNEPLPGEMSLFEIKENVFMVKGVNALPSKENNGFMSNSYAILTKEGWFVVDCLATPELSEQFSQLLLKKDNSPIKYAMITHYHQDHWFGAQSYKKHNTQIIAHKNLKAFAESGMAEQMLTVSKERFKVYDSVKVTSPDIVIDNEDKTIELGGETFVVKAFTPAHTNTDLILHLPKKKMIFVGDLVNYHRVPFVGDRNSFSKGWLAKLDEMKAMDLDFVLTGHSFPLKKSQLDYTHGYLSYMREKISQMKEEGKSVDDVKMELQITPYTKEKTANFFHNANIYKIYLDLDTEDLMIE